MALERQLSSPAFRPRSKIDAAKGDDGRTIIITASHSGDVINASGIFLLEL
jgi:hypothetical protein